MMDLYNYFNMKVLIIVDNFQGGAGNIAQILSESLVDRGYSVALALTDNPTSFSQRRYMLSHVDLIYLPIEKANNKIKLLHQLITSKLKLMQEVKPGIVISFVTHTNIISTIAAKRLSLPIIVSERSNPIVRKESFPWNFLQKVTYKRADRIAVQFECFKNFLSNIRHENYVCLPNIVLENNGYKTNYVRDRVFKVVAVGNLRPIKNYFGMLEIIKEAKQRGLNIKLDVYGIGSQKEEIVRKILEMHLDDTVNLNGHIQNIHEILPQYDCYFMTSFQEGFPNGLSEAMASGLPCIVYKCHDGFEELINTGQNGFLVPFGDIKEFVDDLEKLYADESLRSYIGNNARQISQKYSIDKVVDLWVECIEDVKSQYEKTKRD